MMALRGHFGHGVALSGNLRVALGTGLYLALVGLLGGACGWLGRPGCRRLAGSRSRPGGGWLGDEVTRAARRPGRRRRIAQPAS